MYANRRMRFYTHMQSLEVADVLFVKVKLIVNKDVCAIFRLAPGPGAGLAASVLFLYSSFCCCSLFDVDRH